MDFSAASNQRRPSRPNLGAHGRGSTSDEPDDALAEAVANFDAAAGDDADADGHGAVPPAPLVVQVTTRSEYTLPDEAGRNDPTSHRYVSISIETIPV